MVKASTLRRRASEKAAKAIRRRWRKSKGIWPESDPNFIAWLHRLPCVACWFAAQCESHPWSVAPLVRYIVWCRLCLEWRNIDASSIEAAHIGDRGQAQKCSDREACPLCKIHHDRGSAIGHHVLGKKFWSVYGIPKAELIAALNSLYDSFQ